MFKRIMIQQNCRFVRLVFNCCRQYTSTGSEINYQRNNFAVNHEVADALNNGKPVVALESTIITHGMPYPHNIRTALEVEDIVRKCDVVPATVGVVAGTIHVGMSDALLTQLGEDEDAQKLSRRDLAVACLKNASGGTTVSATMLIAYKCGIKIFVTGGIGGVHRDVERTMDISADLRELGRTPVMVISAGIKSILDVPRTLEYLETEGVTVATLGETTDFPGFFTQTSGLPSPNRIKSIDEAAALLISHSKLDLQSGLLLAIPVPKTLHQLGDTIEDAIQNSIKECSQQEIRGNKVTPHILRRVNELTGGLSLKANISLIKNNAEVGAQIAHSFYKLTKCSSPQSRKQSNEKFGPVVIGGCNIDIVSKCHNVIVGGGASNPSTVSQSVGGVGRNIAETLWRLNSNPFFISAIGCDFNGTIMKEALSEMDCCSGVTTLKNHSTGVYNVIISPNGEVYVAVEDSDIHNHISLELVKEHEDYLRRTPLVVVDANIPPSTMQYICSICSRYDIPLLYEPTGVLKAARGYLAKAPYHNAVTYLTPNFEELHAIYEAFASSEGFSVTVNSRPQKSSLIKQVVRMSRPLLQRTKCILTTLGDNGVLCALNEGSQQKFIHYSLDPRPSWKWLDDPVSNASGAGDSLAAGFAHGLLSNGGDIDSAIQAVTIWQSTRLGRRCTTGARDSVSLRTTDDTNCSARKP